MIELAIVLVIIGLIIGPAIVIGIFIVTIFLAGVSEARKQGDIPRTEIPVERYTNQSNGIAFDYPSYLKLDEASQSGITASWKGVRQGDEYPEILTLGITSLSNSVKALSVSNYAEKVSKDTKKQYAKDPQFEMLIVATSTISNSEVVRVLYGISPEKRDSATGEERMVAEDVYFREGGRQYLFHFVDDSEDIRNTEDELLTVINSAEFSNN